MQAIDCGICDKCEINIEEMRNQSFQSLLLALVGVEPDQTKAR